VRWKPKVLELEPAPYQSSAFAAVPIDGDIPMAFLATTKAVMMAEAAFDRLEGLTKKIAQSI
jgi:hypothetical protein